MRPIFDAHLQYGKHTKVKNSMQQTCPDVYNAPIAGFKMGIKAGTQFCI
jgi:hypothetical protein